MVSGQAIVQPLTTPPPVVETPKVVGTTHKESGVVAEVNSAEIMQPTEVEPQLAPEVKEVGVEVVHELPDLTLSDKNAGIALAKESVVHPPAPSGMVTLSDEDVVKAIKQKKSGNSIFYLALLILKSAHKKLIGG